MERTFVLQNESATTALFAFIKANAPVMADEGRPLAVHVSEYKSKRNGQQNRLYWALLRDISEQAWIDGKQFSSEAWHSYFAGRFVGWQDAPGGIKTPLTTTNLNVTEFSEYVEKIRAYAATELGIEFG